MLKQIIELDSTEGKEIQVVNGKDGKLNYEKDVIDFMVNSIIEGFFHERFPDLLSEVDIKDLLRFIPISPMSYEEGYYVLDEDKFLDEYPFLGYDVIVNMFEKKFSEHIDRDDEGRIVILIDDNYTIDDFVKDMRMVFRDYYDYFMEIVEELKSIEKFKKFYREVIYENFDSKSLNKIIDSDDFEEFVEFVIDTMIVILKGLFEKYAGIDEDDVMRFIDDFLYDIREFLERDYDFEKFKEYFAIVI